MIVVENNNNNPAYNHALEEYLFNNIDDEVFIIWRNRPCVLIGRNQNIYKEVNLSYCQENNLDVVRRLSGGGAIYCDLENMQYTFICKEVEGNSFEHFSKPILKALDKLGIHGEFTGRNDLIIDGKKFSGNAQYHHKGKVLHHGTLLYSGDMVHLKNALKPNPLKFIGKNVDSIVSRVGFLKELTNLSVTELMDHVQDTVMEEYGITEIVTMDSNQEEKILEIMKERFDNPDWNYGKSPDSEMTIEEKHDFGIIEYGIKLSQGRIKDISITGDFFGKKDIDDLVERLLFTPFSKEEMERRMQVIDISDYIEGMENHVFIEDIFKER